MVALADGHHLSEHVPVCTVACTMAWPRYHISTSRAKTSFSTMSATLVEKIQNTRRQRLHEKKSIYDDPTCHFKSGWLF